MIYSNTDLELSVLGSALSWGADELKGDAELIRTEDFQNAAIAALFKKAKSYGFNPALLVANLETTEEKEIYCSACEQPSFISHFPSELAMLKEKARKGRLRSFLATFFTLPDTAMHEEDLRAFLDAENDGDCSGDSFKDTVKYIDEFSAGLDKQPETILSGYSALDNLTGGFRLPSVCIVGAYPSVGKTTFALNIALKAILKGHKSLIFSLEMSREMIFERLAGCSAGVDTDKISKRQLSEPERANVEKALNWLKNGYISVVDNIYGIENIAVAVRRSKPKFVVIDYIQKVTTLQKYGTTREQINHISGEIKRIAKDNNCHVMALSQLSRAGKDAPTMSSLKESGSLEADGDYVILLHRPYVLDKSNRQTESEISVLLDKNKFGRTGKSEFHFDVKTQRIIKEDSRYE
jgi:replicative DNA helicase